MIKLLKQGNMEFVRLLLKECISINEFLLENLERMYTEFYDTQVNIMHVTVCLSIFRCLCIILFHLLTYSSSLLAEHGAPTIVFHLSLSDAALFVSPHDIRVVLNSISSVLLHVFTGRPLLLFLWGFQWSTACLVMLLWGLRRICPILQSSMLVFLSGRS